MMKVRLDQVSIYFRNTLANLSTLLNLKHFWFAMLFLLMLIGPVFSVKAYGAGFSWISSDGLKVGVWYPSDAPEEAARLVHLMPS